MFSGVSKDEKAIWAALLEKAYAKTIGTYLSVENGYTANGIRVLTGLPVYEYNTEEVAESNESLMEMWELLLQADSDNYIMGASTGDDNNPCGLDTSFAFSIISVFTMTAE